jgi:hypothetical protein
MATEIDLDAISSDAGRKTDEAQFVTNFDAMRRKLQILSD